MRAGRYPGFYGLSSGKRFFRDATPLFSAALMMEAMAWIVGQAQEQKSFGSFLQKRTFLLQVFEMAGIGVMGGASLTHPTAVQGLGSRYIPWDDCIG